MIFLKRIVACICACVLMCLCACSSVMHGQGENGSNIFQWDENVTSSHINSDNETEDNTSAEGENQDGTQSPSNDTQSNGEDNKKPQNNNTNTSSKNQTNNTTSKKPSSSVDKNPTSSSSATVNQQTKPQPNPNVPLTAISTDDYYGWKWLEKNGTEAEKKAYLMLVSEIGNYKNSIKFDFNITKEEFNKAYGLYKEDYPEHFWRSTEHTLTSIDKRITKITFKSLPYDGNVDKIKAEQVKVDKAVREVLSKLSGEMSDYEKEVTIHDYIINRTVYKEGENAHSMVGVLVDGKAVCQGYSLAFQYLMRLAGIQCITVTGRFNNQDHMWNMVKLDGEFYHIDVTADDPIMNSGENVEIFDYFNLTDKEIGIDHTIKNKEFTPPTATSTKYEFFTTTGQVYSEFTVDSFAHSIAYAYQHGYKYAYMRYENVDLSKAMKFIKDNYYTIIDKANKFLGSEKIKPDTKINIMYGEKRGIVDFKINY